jgi:class 3 adenylate cyclase/tetratricopeptide (TPR) repeat protein
MIVSKTIEQRLHISDPTVLSAYLPDSVVHHLLESTSSQPTDIDLGLYVSRLQELLQLIVSYVPEYADASNRALPAARPGSLSRLQGTLLAADLSGFTAFSARLGTLGGEGAELVARTISALFSTLFDTLGDWGGSLLKLSGDALTALFSGDDHARRAVAAAMELQRRMAAFQALETPAGIFTLRMRIGLASGDVLLIELGAPERVELLVSGATARRVMELQRRAEPGAVVIGGGTYKQVAAFCQVGTLASGLFRVLDVDPLEPPAPNSPLVWRPRRDPFWELHALIARIEALRPYLVDQHLSRIVDGPPILAAEGDLRPVTVLFAALSDTGRLLEQDDPAASERALAQIQENAQRLWQVVAQHGGTINKLDLHPDGHTLIALFGAPVAQGRDTERAVSCAQALLRTVGAVDQGIAPLLVRHVGLATGRVFAGAVGSAERREYTVMGSVVNLAARLMDIADDGQALVDVATAQIVGRRFRLHEQPPVLIKGYEHPVPFFVAALEQRSRISNLMRTHDPLIGRAAELSVAQAAVGRALGGSGGVVALIGEAGIGKSRLLAEIARSSLVARTPGTIVVVQSQPHSRVQPYGLLAEILRQLYQLPERVDDAVDDLAERVRADAPEHERFLPLLPTLLGTMGEDSPLTQALTPDERRARLQELAVALLLAYARSAPAALIVEDMHWTDVASLDILGALAAVVGDFSTSAETALPILLLCTYRPEGAPTWPAAARPTLLELPPLTPEQTHELIGAWLGPRTMTSQLSAAVVERTQGNPFFIEETARALRERGLVLDSEPPLPATIQSALLARLDRLPLEERYVLQIASAIGSLFDQSLLAQVTGARVALDNALESLAGRGLLHETDDNRYAFAHSLTQETVYESLLFAQRRQLHCAIGDCLREQKHRPGEADPGVLSYHYRRAELWPAALEFAWQAGARAQALYAGDVALEHFQHALEAANRLNDDNAVARRPAILRRVGDLHALAGRYADAVAAYEAALAVSTDSYEQAEVLICWAEACEELTAFDEALTLLRRAAEHLRDGDDTLAIRINVRRGWVLVRRGSLDEARASVEPCLEELEHQELWADLLLVYKVFFHIAMNQSRWSEARSYLRLALTYAEQTGDIREIARIHNNLGVVLAQEGNFQGSTQSFEQAAHAVEQIGDQYNLALVEGNIGVNHYKLGNFPAALARYRSSLNIATAIGNRSLESTVRSNLGEIYRRLDQLADSLDQLLQSVGLCRETLDDIGLAEAYRQLAETYIALDRLSDAEEACELARETAHIAGDPLSEAIAYRVRAILAAKRGDYADALDNVRRSIRMLAELGSTHELGQSMIVQATILMSEEHFNTASSIVEEAILLLEKAGTAADRVQAEQLLDLIQAQVKEIHL